MGRILTLSGVSGSGKTTLAGMFIERMPNAAMVTSYTTRKARTNDVPGEYNYVSSGTYDAMALGGEFLWTATHGSIRHGTKAIDIDVALGKPEGFSIMILVPNIMQALREYLNARGALQAHVPVYLFCPSENLIRRRLEHRGDTRESVKKRIQSERGWDGEAGVSGVPYMYIRNDGPIEAAYKQVRALI